MRPLVLDNETRKHIGEVLTFAKENHYRPGLSENVPGDDARHVVAIFKGYWAVFSFTEGPDGGLYRHLTVSVDGPNYPSPLAAFTIAEAFGFTGWTLEMGEKLPGDWMGDVNKEDHCVTIIQPVRKSEI
jgi:hypothetical protein